MSEVSRDWIESQLAHIDHKIDAEIRHREHIVEAYQQAHKKEHELAEQTIKRGDQYTQQALDDMRQSLDRIEQLMTTFVQREKHDADMDNIREHRELAINQRDQDLETIRNRMDTIERTLRGVIDSNHSIVIDITNEVKTKVAEVNARFQQSLVALGIVLTIIEFWLRK